MTDTELDAALVRGFATTLAAVPLPHRMFRCYAVYQHANGEYERTTDTMPGETSDSALAAFLVEADEEFDGCHRVDQGARVL
jgi:hypothetical protein